MQYTTEGKIQEPYYLSGAQVDLLAAGKSVFQGNSAGFFKSLMGAAKGAFDARQSDAKARKYNTSPADVIQWSGCKDDQTVRLRAAGRGLIAERRHGRGGESYRSDVLCESMYVAPATSLSSEFHRGAHQIPSTELPAAPGLGESGNGWQIRAEAPAIRVPSYVLTCLCCLFLFTLSSLSLEANGSYRHGLDVRRVVSIV